MGNPRTLESDSPIFLVMNLARYDREVAAALFELGRARISEAGTDEVAASTYDFLAWSLFDPRAAVARLEKLPIDPKLPNNAIPARLAVAESLANDHQERWRRFSVGRDRLFGGTSPDF
jgi:hypothetical protein